jgi:hypothetical protein
MVHLLQLCDLHDYTLYRSQENKYTVSLVIIIVQMMSCVANLENFKFACFWPPPYTKIIPAGNTTHVAMVGISTPHSFFSNGLYTQAQKYVSAIL